MLYKCILTDGYKYNFTNPTVIHTFHRNCRSRNFYLAIVSTSRDLPVRFFLYSFKLQSIIIYVQIYGIIFSECKCLELPHRALWVFKGPFAFSRYREQSRPPFCNAFIVQIMIHWEKVEPKFVLGWNFYRRIYQKKKF